MIQASKEGRFGIQDYIKKIVRNGIPMEEIRYVDLKSHLGDTIGAGDKPETSRIRNQKERSIRLKIELDSFCN